eukprot:CAMPEP_0202948650 /NCGR_PEP_ID=MMETSP1395-20130829/14017_1 /ASSEMBLY_ACC=CAM_ASM_000871 /TAXON_ID=5961 /ORGANISM="Blepharisma japonicum, Strain Stock R1072" /LENGTH=52 /DNA_ID=CAMNT_0049650895 /DNA_START=778 /DNA_END=936 /DNA_ORIENTATION=+
MVKPSDVLRKGFTTYASMNLDTHIVAESHSHSLALLCKLSCRRKDQTLRLSD